MTALLATAPSPKFQAVDRRGGVVCGEVNAAGKGAAAGYRRFIYRDASDAAVIDLAAPYEEPEVVQFEQTCHVARGSGNALDRRVCEQAAQARGALERKHRFDAAWAANCR